MRELRHATTVAMHGCRGPRHPSTVVSAIPDARRGGGVVSRAARRAVRAPSRRRARRRARGRAPCPAPTRGSRRAAVRAAEAAAPRPSRRRVRAIQERVPLGSMIQSGSESGPDHSATPCDRRAIRARRPRPRPRARPTARDASSQSLERDPVADRVEGAGAPLLDRVEREPHQVVDVDRLHGRIEDVGHEHRLVVACGPRDPVAAATRCVAGPGDQSRPHHEQSIAECLAIRELDRRLRLAVRLGRRLIGLERRHELGRLVCARLVLRRVHVARRDERPVRGVRRPVQQRRAAANPGWRVTSITASHSAGRPRRRTPPPRSVGRRRAPRPPPRAPASPRARQVTRWPRAIASAAMRTSEPLRSAEDEQVHAVITARHGCRGHACSPSANPLDIRRRSCLRRARSDRESIRHCVRSVAKDTPRGYAASGTTRRRIEQA